MDRKVKRNGSKFIITDPSLIACSHISELNCKPVSNIKRNIAPAVTVCNTAASGLHKIDEFMEASRKHSSNCLLSKWQLEIN